MDSANEADCGVLSILCFSDKISRAEDSITSSCFLFAAVPDLVKVFCFDECRQLFAEFRHRLSEVRDCCIPCGDILLLIRKERLEDMNEISRFRDIEVKL